MVKHRVDTRRVVRYSVRTKGRVPADLARFKTLAQQTYDDPRGWRGRGVKFVRVASGGAFTLWLSEAARVPGFSSVCSAQWSCRVGRNVVINVERWQHASPAWNRAGRSLRDYRHMVVNHETGHWLGKGHASCPRPGALAPVMQQQSKGTQGCRLNPWPTLGESAPPLIQSPAQRCQVSRCERFQRLPGTGPRPSTRVARLARSPLRIGWGPENPGRDRPGSLMNRGSLSRYRLAWVTPRPHTTNGIR
ncbi:DUF3152 domain-containing protein [Nocardioides sp. W3-2-3]|nr:DUF3152 domain-containing protein [Nocardioides convexus]